MHVQLEVGEDGHEAPEVGFEVGIGGGGQVQGVGDDGAEAGGAAEGEDGGDVHGVVSGDEGGGGLALGAGDGGHG